MANLNTILAQLESNWKALHLRWEQSGQVWTDQMHRNFAGQYWDTLAREVSATQQEMEHLAQVIAKARRSVK